MKIGVIVGILTLIIIIIGVFSGVEAQIKWIMYLGLPLVIFAGSVGITFITKRIEAVILGMVISALWLALFA